MRSSILDIAEPDAMARFKALVSGADVFFSNPRAGYLEKYGLTAEELAELRLGLIHVEMSLYGWSGPWAKRFGFDQNAGGVSGVLAREGTPQQPKLTEIFVVNDYVMSWISSVAVAAALKRRAVERAAAIASASASPACRCGSCIWASSTRLTPRRSLASMNIALRNSSARVRRLPGRHRLGRISRTPGFYLIPLVPRGARPEWALAD
ncbi:MAG: L-carnitine dehydratase/bile acid-inducible protein taxon [Bradyrhizobium sp.]|nr:L-carnitine dehydratase/bile acid-inducible protein taxon [Bradyrhizobium sp.]